MPGAPVSLGCAVSLTPGAAGPPDAGFIVQIPHVAALAAGLPLATTGSLCQMVNSISGAPYPLPIPPTGGSTTVRIQGQALLRMGDQIPAGPGLLSILGPPAAPFVIDQGAP